MAAPSQLVNSIVEAIDAAFSGFNPEKIIGDDGNDVRSLLEHAPEIYQALSRNWKTLSAKVEGMAIHQAVPDAMTEMVPTLDGVAAQAEEVNKTFLHEHAQEIDQHDNPRKSTAAESQWNV